MKRISYNKYFDKVYGCFLGKCIGGTAGGPAEGRKELLDEPLNEELLHSALPNDDLDLQILWLELLEERGPYITAKEMAHEFYHKIPYGPGEYGYAKKNYACGIYPPTSGVFNNRYYKNGMGCPIRSEIWACLFPGAPLVARKYVEMDGSVDHQRDSIDAEYFLTVLESEAFFAQGYGDTVALIEKALESVPEGTKIRKALECPLELYRQGKPWQYVRGVILRRFGHADCTNLYQNMALTLLSLLYGGGDFRETVRLGLACGYDTDCICATAASVLGIFRGAKALLDTDGMTDTGLCIEVGTRRREGSIEDLARDVCAAGMSMADTYEGCAEIMERPHFKPLPKSIIPEFTLTALYKGDPVLTPERETALELKIRRNHGSGSAALSIEAPCGTAVEYSEDSLTLDAGEVATVAVRCSVAPDAEILNKSNIFKVRIGATDEDFGLMGATLFKRYGPFLMNIEDLTGKVPAYVPYSKYIGARDELTEYDVLREYHLGGISDIDHPYVDESEPFLEIKEDGRAECEAECVSVGEDLFSLAAIQSYEGAHVDYLVTTLVCPEDRLLELAVGHTAPFKIWVNGSYIGGSARSNWWTCENRHFTVKLRKGENRLILKCAQKTENAYYSIIPKHDGGCWLQYDDIGCKIN